MMLVSYFVGQAKYRIDYNVPRLLFYFLTAGVLYAVSQVVVIPNEWVNMVWRTLLLAVFLGVALRRENISPRQLLPRTTR